MDEGKMTPEEKKDLRAVNAAYRKRKIAKRRTRTAQRRAEQQQNIRRLEDGTVVAHPMRDDHMDTVKDPLIEEMAKKPNFADVMAEEIKDVRVARFLSLISKISPPRSITWCAKSAGLNATELARIWRDSKLNKAYFEIVERMPEVATKVVEDALGKRQSCRRCDGYGHIEVPENMREFFEGRETTICPNCEGKGYIIPTGSTTHAQLIWERVGWSNKGKGMSVNINMNAHSVDATMSDMEGIEAEVLAED
jgi:hypothetical protein